MELKTNILQYNILTLSQKILILTHQQQSAFDNILKQSAFENIVGKGEIARNEQFLLFPQCFLLDQITVYPPVHIFYIIS